MMVLLGGAGSCATGLSLRGKSESPTVVLDVRAEIAGAGGKVTVEVRNLADDAIGVDLDSIRLRDGGGARYAPLGAPQTFLRDGAKQVRRVPHGAVTVAPGGRQTIELDFEKLSATGSSYSLVLPQLYRLGIEGQVGLRALRVPLVASAGGLPAVGGGVDGGYVDPFEQ